MRPRPPYTVGAARRWPSGIEDEANLGAGLPHLRANTSWSYWPWSKGNWTSNPWRTSTTSCSPWMRRGNVRTVAMESKGVEWKSTATRAYGVGTVNFYFDVPWTRTSPARHSLYGLIGQTKGAYDDGLRETHCWRCCWRCCWSSRAAGRMRARPRYPAARPDARPHPHAYAPPPPGFAKRVRGGHRDLGQLCVRRKTRATPRWC